MGAERTDDYPAASRTCFHTEAMTKEQPEYLSYLLRLRRVSGQEAIWHASLEDPHTGELHNFASLEEVFDFLRAQMVLAPVGTQAGDDQPGKEVQGRGNPEKISGKSGRK